MSSWLAMLQDAAEMFVFLAVELSLLFIVISVRIPLYSITDWHRSPISDSHTFDQPGT
ncbi:hypothetical protein BvCmsSINP015_02443 [Escherichia coli]|nr:hypothetical protein [Escherichia coli]GDT23981.1 hypothetical protein BvCmsSINP015_02443 [Escherichia coli]